MLLAFRSSKQTKRVLLLLQFLMSIGAGAMSDLRRKQPADDFNHKPTSRFH